jgi:hypothetical protein
VVVSQGAGFTLVAMRFPEQRRSLWFWAARRCETGRRERVEVVKGCKVAQSEMWFGEGKRQ